MSIAGAAIVVYLACMRPHFNFLTTECILIIFMQLLIFITTICTFLRLKADVENNNKRCTISECVKRDSFNVGYYSRMGVPDFSTSFPSVNIPSGGNHITRNPPQKKIGRALTHSLKVAAGKRATHSGGDIHVLKPLHH